MEFKRISDAELVQVSEETNLLVEVNGEVKRTASTEHMKVEKLKNLITKFGGNSEDVQSVDEALERLCGCEFGGGGSGGASETVILYLGSGDRGFILCSAHSEDMMGDLETALSKQDLIDIVSNKVIRVYCEEAYYTPTCVSIGGDVGCVYLIFEGCEEMIVYTKEYQQMAS